MYFRILYIYFKYVIRICLFSLIFLEGFNVFLTAFENSSKMVNEFFLS